MNISNLLKTSALTLLFGKIPKSALEFWNLPSVQLLLVLTGSVWRPAGCRFVSAASATGNTLWLLLHTAVDNCSFCARGISFSIILMTATAPALINRLQSLVGLRSDRSFSFLLKLKAATWDSEKVKWCKSFFTRLFGFVTRCGSSFVWTELSSV